jgi:hypothetical protein
MRAVVETDKYQEVKCAVYDKNGDYLTVESQWVSAPVDEVVLDIPGGSHLAESLKCWEK